MIHITFWVILEKPTLINFFLFAKNVKNKMLQIYMQVYLKI